jgi:hypothetical protein
MTFIGIVTTTALGYLFRFNPLGIEKDIYIKHRPTQLCHLYMLPYNFRHIYQRSEHI